MSLAPSNRICSPTNKALRGSSHIQPEKCTSVRPNTTPTEVHTSVIKCFASASKAIERKRTEARRKVIPTTRLITVLTPEKIRPIPIDSIATGKNKRCIAAYKIPIAAAIIRMPSKALEKYSALLCPKG